VDPEDARHLRRAIALAQEGRDRGEPPFGAVILPAEGGGAPLTEARNLAAATGDSTAHAEMAAIRAAAAAHGRERLRDAVLYASTEPCAMCAAAACVAGLGRIVFGIREGDLPRARGGPLPWVPVQLPAAEVAARLRRPLRVEGPFLEAEAAVPHAGLGAA
jgi:tRNA(Arg) A34 adenosine deaminase TadA